MLNTCTAAQLSAAPAWMRNGAGAINAANKAAAAERMATNMENHEKVRQLREEDEHAAGGTQLVAAAAPSALTPPRRRT